MTGITEIVPRSLAGEHDIEAIYKLMEACEAQDKVDDLFSINQLRLELTGPTFDRGSDLRLWEEAGGSLVGVGRVAINDPSAGGDTLEGRLLFRVHPEARGKGLEGEIINGASESLTRVAGARGQKKAQLTCGTRDTNRYSRQIVEQEGFQPVR